MPRPGGGVVEIQAVEVVAAVDEPAPQGLQGVRAHFVEVETDFEVGVVPQGFEFGGVEAAGYAHEVAEVEVFDLEGDGCVF